jgi:predicted dehydrogenase
VAVGSRSQAGADAFADQFEVPQRHSSYEALAADPEVDVVYIATPHAFHQEHSLLCLNHGKAVLCEKPFTINAAEAKVVVQTARSQGLFLMEAMWSRFFPLMGKIRQLLNEGVIGQVQQLTADFGFRGRVNPESRLYKPALGGGALLDVGVYAVSLASMIYGGPPSRIASFAALGETGVDENDAIIFAYPAGQMALISTSLRTTTSQEAVIMGTEGRLKIHSQWWVPKSITLTRFGQGNEVIEMPFEGNGYNYEAREVMRCMREGRSESDVMPLDETLSIMRTMDEMRAQWGLKYPME